MTSEETKPLLIRVNPSWNRKPNVTSAAIPSSDASSTSSDVQRNDREHRNRITCVLNGETDNNWKVKFALASILASVILERMVYYGLVGNLVMFLNLYPFKWKIFSAVSATYMFFGICFVMSLVGGWISDSFLGRFKTIVLSYGIYMCGYILLPFLSISTDGKKPSNMTLPDICLAADATSTRETIFAESCSWIIVITLIIIAISAGMLKANICPFGSDQLAHANQQTQLSFFNWFYWCINIGSFLGLGIISYIEQQQKFIYGFIACTVALGISAIIFIAGRPFYICQQSGGSVLTNIFRIIREAWRNKREQQKLRQSLNMPVSIRSRASTDDPEQKGSKIPFLDYAKHSCGGSFHNSIVNDVKKLGMILAVFAVLIPYWLVYFQMQTTFMLQGLNMRLSFAGPDANATDKTKPRVTTPEIAVAWFTLFDALFVIILLPLFDRIIYPRMARAGYHFTFAKRIVLGMLFSITAMVSAGVVEQFRWNALDPDINGTCFRTFIPQKIGHTTYNASNLSVLWQIPQYVLIGISEVFASVACLQFAVMVAPNSMKAAVTGLYYFFCGLGGLLGTTMLTILKSTSTWFIMGHHNFNCWYPCTSGRHPRHTHTCHIDFYFFFLAGCEGLGLVLFFIVARVYRLNIDELTFHARLKNREVRAAGKRQVQGNTSTSSSVTPS